MLRRRFTVPFLAFSLTLVAGMVARAGAPDPAATATPAVDASRIARGEYLVNFGSCHDCHTPWKLGPNGPEPDMSRALTGHPSDLVMPPPPAPQGPWITTAAASMTAWSGPWGVSFTANLTPDRETGLGEWTEEMFIATMRTGRHQGKGRPILPPMPYFSLAKLTDDDLAAVFAYLQSLKPVSNRVPAPIDPPEADGQ